MIAIQVNRLERPLPATHAQLFVIARDVGPHGFGGVHKRNIALNGLQTNASNRDACLARAGWRDGTERDEVTGR